MVPAMIRVHDLTIVPKRKLEGQDWGWQEVSQEALDR